MEGDAKAHPIFKELSADQEDTGISEIESLCLNCERNGVTRLLLTRIPHFKDVIVSSFSCPHCGYANNEIQSGGRIQDYGIRITVDIQNEKDLNRQIVRTDYCTVKIPEISFEIPPNTQKGALTTVEGILERAIAGLQQQQPVRRALDKSLAEQLDKVISKLEDFCCKSVPFTLVLDDPSGNSYVQNYLAPRNDPAMTVDNYARNLEQNKMLALVEDDAEDTAEISASAPLPQDIKEEVLNFQTNCPSCNAPAETNMKVVAIPHFKEVIIMATNCESCGHRTNEVKSGAGISALGSRISLLLKNSVDLTRDVLKSDTCALEVPELQLELSMGTLGGKFTTVEGLLVNVKEQLQSSNPFTFGDSSNAEFDEKLKRFIGGLDEVITGRRTDVHFILDDPAGNSYIQNLCAPDPDSQLEIKQYERTFEQNELLGLNDMKTENYADKATEDS